MIQLHPRLEKDSILLGEFSLSTLLLLNDANYPWFALVPNRHDIREIYQLSEADQQQLLKESMYFCHCLEQVFTPDKLNIAAIGNVVPQLHIHHIARYTNDACWPAPVWGAITAMPYHRQQVDDIKQQLAAWFDMNTAQAFQWAPGFMTDS